MAQFSLKAGASIDVLTKPELDDSLKGAWQEEMTARGRGMKMLRFAGGVNFTSAAGPTGWVVGTPAGLTPSAGYIWNLRALGLVFGAGSACNVFVGDTGSTVATSHLVDHDGSAATFHTFHWGSGQEWLRAGEYLLAVPGAAAIAITGFKLGLVEVPEELAWKLM